MSKILVIGSSNTDLIAKVDRFPSAGETIEGRFFLQAFGGKGANQALAAHRLGGDVRFVTCLGNDANGQNTLAYYKEQGLDVSASRVVDNVPSGTAVILVNGDGENCIVITPGANNKLSADEIQKIEREIAVASYVVMQMEIPYESVKKACQLAVKHDTKILLNVAPARKIEPDLLSLIDILVVNETEIETISEKKIAAIGEHAVMDTLLTGGAKTVILTLGGEGCVVLSSDINKRIPAFHVTPVDTTAAGDTFCGALVARLSQGVSLVEAATFASAAAALCVTGMGAQPSIPHEEDVKKFLHAYTSVAGNGGWQAGHRKAKSG